MKSNICKIEKGTKDLDAILKESEKVAIYNEFTHKQSLHLRLICEELDGMLPELVGDFEGKLWIEVEDGICCVRALVELDDVTAKRKEQLIGVAKNKKNAAAVGIVGKIRSAMENFFLDYDESDAAFMSSSIIDMHASYDASLEYAYYWNLCEYRNTVKKEDKKEAWDELEKSVIASVADDITVGIKGKKAEITIIKKLA